MAAPDHNVDALVQRLHTLGIELRLENEALRYRAPTGVFTPELKAAVQAAKSELIARLRASSHSTQVPPVIPRTDRRQPVRMSFGQERIWFLYRLEGPSSTYNVTPVFRLRGPLDQQAMASALAALVERHETLRMRFAEVDGIGVQIVDPPGPVTIDRIDLRPLPAAERMPAAESIILERTAQSFDLECGPVLKVGLVTLKDDDHILLPFMHHIVSDGWSLGVFHREFGLLYEALTQRKEPGLPPLPIQYPDYSAWVRSAHEGTAGQAGLTFWRQALQGAPQSLALPTDFPRPAIQRFQGRVLHRQIPLETTRALQELAQTQGCTLFMVLLAAYGVLLQRHCGQDDMLVGSPVANRPLRETEGLIGCFVNTVVLRLQLAGAGDFLALLQRVRQTTLDAYAHQDVPVESVIDTVIHRRDPSRMPLYQAQISLLNVPGAVAHLSELEVEPMRMERMAAKNDLCFILELGPEGIGFELEYNTDLFHEETADRLGADYLALLAAVTAAPHTPIGDLPVPSLPQAPPAAPAAAPPAEHTDLAAAFAATVAAHPNAIAVQDSREAISYATLDRQSDAIAARLQALGLAPETPVGLLCGRSTRLIAAMLGVLKAGAAYLPLAPEHPAERLRDCLRQSAAGALLCDPEHAALATSVAGSVPVHAIDADLLAASPATVLRPVADPGRLAYIIFTSGSTGRPKGVMIEHRAVLNLVAALRQRVHGELGEGLNIALMASPAFDASVQQIFPALLGGHRLCLIDAELRQDGAALCQRLADWRIDLSDCTPSLLAVMLDGGLADTASPRLRHLLVGGEPLPRDLLARLYAGAAGQHITVSNVYGPTECCVDVSCLRTQVGQLPEPAIVPIGQPLAGCRLLIVDEQNQVMPPGQVGELLIGGVCLGRGYVNDVQRTAERFVALPQLGLERAYRSGDLCRQGPDGVIEFLGRNDDQVKIRGYRIELGEIESRLRQHPDIAAACVLARSASSGQRELAAYLVCRGEPPSRRDIHDFLCQTLPDYMVPAWFVPLSTLPLNTSGKIERNALPNPEGASVLLSGVEHRAASSAAEEALAAVWQQTLRMERIGVHDNYFASGGDSIKALQVAARLREAGWALEIRDLFQHPTIAQLAPCLKRVPGGIPTTAAGPWVGDALLGAVQRFFFDTYGPARQFNQAVLLNCRVRVEAPALAAALEWLHQTHDVLRSCFVRTGDGWRQRFDASVQPTLRCHDLGRTSNAHEVLLEHCTEAQRAFALGQSPLFSADLFALPDGTQRLLLSAHHLIIDGVSWRILIDDLERLLQGASSLPPASTPYPAWVESQRAYAASADAEESAWWSSPLLAAPPRLPVDFSPEGPDRHRDRAELRAALNAPRTRDLLTGAHRRYSTEINDLLIAALVRAWCAWSGDRHCALSLEGHGREALAPGIDLSRSVGWFTSIFPVAFTLAPGDPGEQIKQVKDGLRAIPHKGASYAVLRHLAGVPGLPELPPLAFNYLGRFDGGSECFEPAPESPPSTVAPDTAWPWPLEITAAVITDRLEITLAYSRRRFAPTTAQRLLDGLAAELDRVIAHTLELREVALTVSDIAYGGFTQAQLDAFLATLAGPGEVENIYPLTPLQQGMYFHAQSDPDSSAYFEQWCLRVRGELRPDLVRAAWQTLVRRHETLRSIFTPGDGLRPLQAVLREQAVEITSVDFSRAPPQEAKARLQAARAADIARSFHLDTGPLTRLLLARLDDNHWEIVWSHHHIVLDGWSVAQLQREFLEIYAALRSGRTPELPPALAFHRFVRTLSEQSDLVFWQQYLQGHEEVASIPQGETLDATDSHSELRRHWCALSTRDTQRLDRLCRQTGCTVSVFLQAVWGVLLGRYCNREDVVFGYVFSGRTAPLPDIETAVGLFINTLPVRVRLRPGESFRQLLARLHGEVAELAARQQTPLADIQRACMHSGSLFDHVLALENYPVDEAMHHADPAATGFETVAVLSNDRTHYDFDLVVLPASDDLRFRFSYSPSVHDDAQVARLAGQLLHAVGALLDDPDQDPCRLNVLPPDQWQAVVEADPPLAAAPTKENTLFELFATQAAARPHAPAVLAPHGDDRWWSYGELAARASALGGQLRQAGVAPHDRIAVFLPPAEPAIAALLGVLHAGAAYVPVDPEYPPERVRFILEDACVAAVLTDHAHAALMPPLAVPVLEIDAPPVVPASPAMNAEPAAPVAPDATAYVIYTSGSTGTPKGCEISHRNVMRLLFQQRHEQRFDFSFGPGDTWVVAHSLSFDFSVWEIYGALLHGGRLLVPSREAVRDLPEFHALLARHRVSVLNQTPLAFYNLADYEASLETPGLGALRYVVFGGDRLEPARLHPWAAIHPLDRVALVNMYGITETTVHVSFCRLTPEHLAAPGPSPIGRPLAETMVYVVDHHLNPQPAGAPGELVVGGSGVGKGYLNRPELTAERFMPNPFHAGRLYRSGDLGWRTSDGRLFYLGRNDHQVKIRGHRIEPAEIEAALRTLPGVEQAVVLPENGAAGLELSAYVTGAAMQQPLREALAGRLPAHLMPTHLVHCEALPLTANGKLDRQALRKLREAAVHGDNSDGDRYQPPLGEQEQLLAEVWRGVLGVPRIGRHDRYLSLGGDSIKSIQVLARLRAAGWNLPLKDLFRHPTIAELAPRLVALQRTVSRNDTTDDGKPFSLTPIQLRFFAEWPHAERHHFNHAMLLRCTAGTTGEHLRQAVQILVDSHGALRLRFIRQAGGGWLQRVGTRGEAVAFDSISVEGTEALARHAEGAQRSLDIKHGPLLRALHYQLPNGTDRLLLIAHHLCIDGVSWRIVQQDMELLLRQLSLGQPVALPPTTDGFGRWSTLLRQARGDFLGQLPYWRQMDTAPAKLPSELQAPGRYGDLATAGFSLSEAATRELKQAGRAYQTHVGELLLAAFVRALHQWTELDTLQLALESHGRDVLEPSDLSRSVGWFTALYPLQLLLAYQSADRQIKEAKEALRRVPQAGLGYGVLRYLGEDDAGLCAQPPVCFNYLGEFDPPTDDALLVPCDGEIGAVVSPDGPRPFALELSASIVGGRFQCSLGFTADRVVPSRRLQLCQTLESELDTLVVHCLDKTAPELTPSDLTYKELSLDELDGIFDED